MLACSADSYRMNEKERKRIALINTERKLTNKLAALHRLIDGCGQNGDVKNRLRKKVIESFTQPK